MDKEKYMRVLRQKLASLPQEEIDSALHYVSEYYDECQDDDKAYHDLGDPNRFASQIKADFVIKKNEEKGYQITEKGKHKTKVHNDMKSIIILVLGILSLPLSLPLIAMVFVLVIMLFLLLIVIPALILFMLMITFIACIAVSTKIIFGMSTILLNDILLFISIFLICSALLCLCIAGFLALMGRFVPWLIHKLSDLFVRLKGEKKDDEMD